MCSSEQEGFRIHQLFRAHCAGIVKMTEGTNIITHKATIVRRI